MDSQDLQKILDQHRLWIATNHEEGRKDRLEDADLRGAGLELANLRGADLENADLTPEQKEYAKSQGAIL